MCSVKIEIRGFERCDMVVYRRFISWAGSKPMQFRNGPSRVLRRPDVLNARRCLSNVDEIEKNNRETRLSKVGPGAKTSSSIAANNQ